MGFHSPIAKLQRTHCRKQGITVNKEQPTHTHLRWEIWRNLKGHGAWPRNGMQTEKTWVKESVNSEILGHPSPKTSTALPKSIQGAPGAERDGMGPQVRANKGFPSPQSRPPSSPCYRSSRTRTCWYFLSATLHLLCPFSLGTLWSWDH